MTKTKQRDDMAATKIGPKHQVTIPKEVFERLHLEVGEYLDVEVKEDRILMVPKKLIPKDQAWFYTPEWQAKEREADEAIARGEVSGPFSSIEALKTHLMKKGAEQQ
ncbi:MAG: AbrB/MazE/SpoVT family DNA-binding domain-containing protein [Candidatus Latescibacteria bacterium]|nr:AbrB/MazE/SpoVT family DNA-binding domain-containing protein [Candidatus Latescibacterota bacterium]